MSVDRLRAGVAAFVVGAILPACVGGHHEPTSERTPATITAPSSITTSTTEVPPGQLCQEALRTGAEQTGSVTLAPRESLAIDELTFSPAPGVGDWIASYPPGHASTINVSGGVGFLPGPIDSNGRQGGTFVGDRPTSTLTITNPNGCIVSVTGQEGPNDGVTLQIAARPNR